MWPGGRGHIQVRFSLSTFFSPVPLNPTPLLSAWSNSPLGWGTRAEGSHDIFMVKADLRGLMTVRVVF